MYGLHLPFHGAIASAGTTLYNSVSAVVVGENGRPPSEGRRTCLFTSTQEVILMDDEGKVARADLDRKILQ